MSHDETDATAAKDADKSGNHERMVKDIFTNASGAGTVEANTREVRRISWQEEVAVARADKAHDDNRVHADG